MEIYYPALLLAVGGILRFRLCSRLLFYHRLESEQEMGKRIAEEVLVRLEIKRRRNEGKRPSRLLSHISKSHAFSYVQSENRIQRGVDFFFPLLDTSRTTFKCTAFAEEGPASDKDENAVHHPYFIKQMKLLVDAAIDADISLTQQVYWSKSGRWMSLDDGHAAGVEPDFCMTAIVDTAKPVPIEGEGVKLPQSKYDVTVAMEMKKTFVETDQIEALDYGERLLCFQRGRRFAITALFHCCEKDKIIRWLKTEELDGQFTTAITRPASLAPHGDGQRQLLTILTRSSEELGLDFPQVTASDTNEPVKIKSLIGHGATSTVYAATFKGHEGVLKLLKHGNEMHGDHELLILNHLQQNQVCGIPGDVTKVCDGALFFGQELAHVSFLNRENLSSLIDCLQSAHQAGVVHRDVRPDNIMQDSEGNIYLIDWGFAYLKDDSLTASIPGFQGTFRYASDEVLASAILGVSREPQPKDDLESLVRILLSQSSPSLQGDLAGIEANDLRAAHRFWSEKRKANQRYEWIFTLANSCSYVDLKAATFG